jgi:hypothetical protein
MYVFRTAVAVALVSCSAAPANAGAAALLEIVEGCVGGAGLAAGWSGDCPSADQEPVAIRPTITAVTSG